MEADPPPVLPDRPAPPLDRSSLHYHRRPAGRQKRLPSKWGLSAHLRRISLVTVIGLQTFVATDYMVAVLPYHGGTWLEIAVAVAFAASFAWISLGAWLGLIGFCIRLTGGDRRGLIRRTSRDQYSKSTLAPTAILMPLYHESVPECLAGLGAVYRSLERSGKLDNFEFFILSDSRNTETWLAEKAGWAQLVNKLNAQGRIHYRRRRVNLKYKSGNIADFLRRWGRKYKYFMILDADSLMEGKTITRMVRLMQCHPQVGILQTVPTIIGARSPFARIQQFANRLYTPLFAAGLAAIQLGDGAYWGHNALIRTRAFMDHCALSNLRGIGLFRGEVLSHDFVEAAFMRRGGYEVWLEPGLAGSYEQTPPTLVDELTRDRRWAKGNLQHIAIMLGDRVALAHRMTFFNGVLSYASAPLWLFFMVLSGVEVLQFALFKINYFPNGHQLIPLWPQWHPQWATRLVLSTAFVLFLPKILSFADAFCHGQLRQSFGGGVKLTISVFIETLVSIILAPVRMLAHTRFVFEALANLNIRWAGQNRGGELSGWASLKYHGFGAVLGIVWSGFAWWLKLSFLYWTLPVTLPLILAPLVSVVLSKKRLGHWMGQRSLLCTPEDKQAPNVVREYYEFPKDIGDPGTMSAFDCTMQDPIWNQAASICGNRRPLPQDLATQAFEQGLDSLVPKDKEKLADNKAALAYLHEAVKNKDHNFYPDAAGDDGKGAFVDDSPHHTLGLGA